MRLIDADALLERYDLNNATKYGNKNKAQQANSYSTMFMYEIADMIDDAPTIDAVEQKHGHWIEWAGSLEKCSVCGYEYIDRIECRNYCGNCGAKMCEVTKDEQ